MTARSGSDPLQFLRSSQRRLTPTRHISWGGSPSVIFQSPHNRQSQEHRSARHLTPPHSERMSATLTGVNCNRPPCTPGSEKVRLGGNKSRKMALKGIPTLPLSRGLFLRHLRATFASFLRICRS